MSMEGVGRGVVLVLVIIGIVLLMVSRIYAAGVIKLDYDEMDKVEDISYNTTIINAVAIALVSMSLLIGAVALEGLGPHTRSGLAIAAGIVIGLNAFLGSIS